CGIGRTGQCLHRASHGQHLPGCHDRRKSRPGHGHAWVSHLARRHARPAVSAARWPLDHATDHVRYRCCSIVRDGSGSLSPVEESWTGGTCVRQKMPSTDERCGACSTPLVCRGHLLPSLTGPTKTTTHNTYAILVTNLSPKI